MATPNQRQWAQARDRLAGTITALGFPEEFADLLAKQLGSPRSIDRMTDWLYHVRPQWGYTRWLNSETRWKNEEEE